MKDWLRTILFLSAFSPVLLTMAYVRYDIYGWRMDVVQLIIIGLLGTLLPFIIIKLIKSQGESLSIQVKKIESNDFMLLAFIFSYFSPIILKAADVSINTIMLILSFIGIILWLISSLPSHPLLRIMKFKFYKIESSNGVVYILISKRDILDPKEVNRVKKISRHMLIED
ncbi:hypothetical protein IG605_007855 [Pectobacterium quasiaquaticum]|uniref:hypothetical protein n=1 Tax=Pectobacterium quasiaquaticum TaxID=2774015 RepID=UPI00187602C2|nr:hypothetical protein [Pectobacterium quasiaquaticum]MBE5213028.1 hypothetical protein [Pectobacterium quasiaquaticum]MBE5224322.1 hypothetical protein [Pectobacterium quasiaquaticum]URG54176.1 hypothetical protein IG605_007855 [Pectobacterium quasiaquaticum]